MADFGGGPSQPASPIHPLLAAAAIVTYFYGAKLYSTINLEKASPRHNSPQRSGTIAVCLGVLSLLYGLEFTHFLSSLYRQRGVQPEPADVISSLLLLWYYGSTAINSWLAGNAIWHQYTGTLACALTIELGKLILLSNIERDIHNVSAMQSIKIGILLLCPSLTWHFQTIPISVNVFNQLETQREQLNAAMDDSDNNSDFDADFDSDASDVEVEKEHKKQRLERLQEAGNWLSFVKPYRIFVPMLFPVGRPKLQLCVALIVLEIVVTRFFGLMAPQYMGVIADKLTSGSGVDTFPWRDVMIWAMLTMCESELFVSIRAIAFLPLEQYAHRQLSMTAFKHVMDLSMDFHHDKSSSDLIRVVEQGQSISEILQFLCFDLAPLLVDVTIALVYIASTFDAYMASIVVSGAVFYIWLRTQTAKWAFKTRKRYNQAMREQDKVQYEALSNWSTVSQFNREEYEVQRYSEHIDRFDQAWTDSNMAYNRTDLPVLTVCRLLATGLAMYRVSQGIIPLGELITFTAVYSTIMAPITSVSFMVRRMQTLLADSERLLVLLQTNKTVCDVPAAKKLMLQRGKIEFKDVSFSYDPRKKTLSKISFVAKPGTTVAFVGETGGGKSTIMKMIYRYYDVTSGSIRIDGQDIREVQLNSLRDVFGFVPQNPALFNMTILENLRYARLDATDGEIEDACRAACIHDKIMHFPDKYQSKVGERGVKLSGGEMQRIAIARAILRDPKIVLLDEATSQIDALTEAQIQKALRRLTVGRTTFVVAHRLSTIQHADLIIVIENGRIVEQGSHEELRKMGGRYVALWSKQTSKEHMTGSLGRSDASTPMTSSDEYDSDSD